MARTETFRRLFNLRPIGDHLKPMADREGFAVPGADGRAGMAAIVVDDRLDFENFARHLARRLPAYAHPVFIRVSNVLEATETFKQKKHQLVRDRFNPRIVDDRLFFRDPQSGAYRALDAANYARIVDATIRV